MSPISASGQLSHIPSYLGMWAHVTALQDESSPQPAAASRWLSERHAHAWECWGPPGRPAHDKHAPQSQFRANQQ